MLCLWPLRKACAAGSLWNLQQYTAWLVPAGPNPTSKALCPPFLGICEVAAGLCQGADRFAMI